MTSVNKNNQLIWKLFWYWKFYCKIFTNIETKGSNLAFLFNIANSLIHHWIQILEFAPKKSKAITKKVSLNLLIGAIKLKSKKIAKPLRSFIWIYSNTIMFCRIPTLHYILGRASNAPKVETPTFEQLFLYRIVRKPAFVDLKVTV